MRKEQLEGYGKFTIHMHTDKRNVIRLDELNKGTAWCTSPGSMQINVSAGTRLQWTLELATHATATWTVGMRDGKMRKSELVGHMAITRTCHVTSAPATLHLVPISFSKHGYLIYEDIY
jgi:hypothetical protein